MLLRGLTRDSRHWGAFPGQLRTALPGDVVVTIDLPGNGILNHLDSPVEVAAMTAHCRAELQRRGVAAPVRLLAMSLGAMAAIDWATRYPEDIECAALINTSLRGLSPFYRRLRVANYAVLLKLVLLRAGPQQWERTILRLTTRHPPMPNQLLADWTRWRIEHPVSSRNALRQLIAAARFPAPPQAPRCPVLLMASTQDGLVDPSCSQTLAAQWHCAIAWHPSAGHDIPLDDSAWVASEVSKMRGKMCDKVKIRPGPG